MSSSDCTLPLKVATYKLNFHAVNSSREGLRDRIQRDCDTDVWCLQGVNLSKQLKDLENREAHYFAGMALVHNTARLQLIEKDSVNFALPLVVAAEERPCIADSFPVSHFHLRKLKLFVGFAAYEMLPQPAVSSSASTGPSAARLVATHRVLVVNVDFERYRDWGDAFMCNLLRVLLHHIWGANGGLARQWNCSHVVLAGSFFFTPGSAPYLLLTSRSGGVVEEMTAHAVVPPCALINFDNDVDAREPCSTPVQTCVVAVAVGDVNRCRQLLGVQLCRGDVPVVVPQMRLCCLNPRTGTFEPWEGLSHDAAGWWQLLKPRDTTAVDAIVVRVEWRDHTQAAGDTPLSVRLRVHSFGVLTPQRQDAEGHPVGVALLCSVTAGTVSEDDAVQLGAAVARRLPSMPSWAERLSAARRAFGEPVVTALYKNGAEIVPDCYDYVFVSTFTGAAVISAPQLALDDFDREAATAHLPVSCTVSIPAVVR